MYSVKSDYLAIPKIEIEKDIQSGSLSLLKNNISATTFCLNSILKQGAQKILEFVLKSYPEELICKLSDKKDVKDKTAIDYAIENNNLQLQALLFSIVSDPRNKPEKDTNPKKEN